MFLKETCKQCGTCLSQCPFIEMPIEKAKLEISLMIQKGVSKEIVRNCAGCSYCDIVCPTQSNPSLLRKEILLKQSRDKGVVCLPIISEEMPLNLMSIGLEFEKEKKLKDLNVYSNPSPSKEVFYLGCSLSYIYTDLAQTKLLEPLPMVGGMRFCCGGYVHHNCEEEETRIKGRKLLQELKRVGIEKMITFCPGCDRMIGKVYPGIIPEFNIENVNIVQYLLEQYYNGKIEFSNPLNQRMTFHDSCAWRNMESEVHENPRKLLEAMGAEILEMKHNRKESMCCGAPLTVRNPQLADSIAEKRVLEAKETGAQAIVISCTGCFALAGKAKEHNMDIYNITELAQIAVGEKPPHRIIEIQNQLRNDLMKKISENPDVLNDRYRIEGGDIRRL